MANVTEAYGLKPTRQLNGSPFINAQNRYRIASNNSTAIFQGDLVQPLSTGTITRSIANDGNVTVGVFNALLESRNPAPRDKAITTKAREILMG